MCTQFTVGDITELNTVMALLFAVCLAALVAGLIVSSKGTTWRVLTGLLSVAVLVGMFNHLCLDFLHIIVGTFLVLFIATIVLLGKRLEKSNYPAPRVLKK